MSALYTWLLKGERSLFVGKTDKSSRQWSDYSWGCQVETDSNYTYSRLSGRITPRCELTLLATQLSLIFTTSHEIEYCAHLTGTETELGELKRQVPTVLLWTRSSVLAQGVFSLWALALPVSGKSVRKRGWSPWIYTPVWEARLPWETFSFTNGFNEYRSSCFKQTSD